ncbi:hypothetical protein MUK42_17261 [Musa troglodytarum]|uniref:Uncharacterized protein n=1 Tax=Musa troglodytarum TaxID=320322 RepID=A0A9E7H3N5_9LILI|nr:hypothetical protein MUK42_17261 [Musa troglodytarum]
MASAVFIALLVSDMALSAPGFGFLLIGLGLHPSAPSPASPQHGLLLPSLIVSHHVPMLVLLGSLASMSMDLFIGPEGTYSFDHASVFFSFLISTGARRSPSACS